MGLFDKKRRRNYVNPKIYTRTSREMTINFNPVYIWIFLVITGIVFLIWWLFFSDFFKIKEIVIEGTINESIKKEIDKFYGQNIFLFTVGGKDKELAEKQTSVEKLNIIKGIPDMLKVEMLVRKPQIRWKSQDKIYFIDNEGIVFNLEEGREKYEDLPIIRDTRDLEVEMGSKIVTTDFVKFIEEIVARINEKIDKEIEEIKINDTTLHLEMQFKNSYRVFFDTLGKLSDQIYLLNKIIEKNDSEIKDYVDLRVEKKGYYK